MPSQIPLTSKEEVYVKEFCRHELYEIYKNLPQINNDKILYEIKFTTSPKHKLNLRKNKPREVNYDIKKQEIENISFKEVSDLDISKIKFVHSSPPTSVRCFIPDFFKEENRLDFISKFPGKVFTSLVAEKEEFNNRFKIKLTSLYKLIFHRTSSHRSIILTKLNDLLNNSGFEVKNTKSTVRIFGENKFKDVYTYQL